MRTEILMGDSIKTWITLDYPELKPTNHIARNASGDVFTLEGELDCQVCYGDQPDLHFLDLDCLDELKLLKQIAHSLAEKSSVTQVTESKTSSKK
ncbi:hypothetical protein ACTXT7_015867, partial [Hymenolepis weldensis]